MIPVTITGTEIDEFVFDVKITHLIDQAPDPACRDSAEDFHGCREIEWHLTYASECDESGECIRFGDSPRWLSRLTRDHHEPIEAKIWHWIEQKKEARHV